MHKIRTSLLATAAVLAFTGASYAADMGIPRKAPAPYAPPPAFSWTGFYVGIAGGAGWGTIENNLNSVTIHGTTGEGSPFSSTFNVNSPIGQNQINGWLFGGTVGYNWQAAPWLVLGIEGDWDWTDFEGTTPCVIGLLSCHDKVSWTADVAGRVGFVVDRAMVYAKGGVAWAHTSYNISAPFIASLGGPNLSASASDTRVGALLGAGIEYAFLPNWSAKIEYNFMDFGTKNVNYGPVPVGISSITSASANTSVREVIHTVKVGVNYRFNWGP